MDQEILSTIKESLTSDGRTNIEEVTMDASFEDLGIDSITALVVINDLEDKYEIQVENEEAFKITSIGEAVNIVKELIKAKNEQ